MFLAFKHKAAVFYEREFAGLGETYIATVDGSYGIKGFVTDVIADKGSSTLILFIHVDQLLC